MNYLSELPFYGLTDRREFAKAVGSWVYDTVLTLEERDLFENVLESPDKNDQDLLTVTNIYKLQLLNFTHQWHSKKLPNIFNQHFRYASEVHTYNTRYASKSNFYKPRSRTNIGKQTTAAMATELWQQLPTHIKDLSTYNFPKTLKEYLLAEQLTY